MNYKVPYERTLPWQPKWLLWLVIVFTSKHLPNFPQILRAPALKVMRGSKLLPPLNPISVSSQDLCLLSCSVMYQPRDEIQAHSLFAPESSHKACVCSGLYWCFGGDRVGLQGRSFKHHKTESKTHLLWKPPAILPTEVPWLLSLVCLLLRTNNAYTLSLLMLHPQPTTGLLLYI